MAIVKAIYRGLRAIESALGFAVAVLLFLMVLLIGLDVAMRYVAHMPIAWTYEIMSLVAMPMLFYGVLSEAHRGNHHVSVDIFVLRLPRTVKLSFDVLLTAMAIVAFAVLWDRVAARLVLEWSSGNAIIGVIDWPTWMGPLIATLGSGVLLVRLVLSFVATVLWLVVGDDAMAKLVELPDTKPRGHAAAEAAS